MGRSFIAIIAAVSVMSSGLVDAAPSRTEELSLSPSVQPVRFDEVYVPVGFDSNDNVQIMAEGNFADSCWRLHETPVAIDFNRHVVTIRPTASRGEGICAQAANHFQELIQIGRLPAGQWQIVQGENSESVGQLSISPASTESIDEHVYAPVTKLEFRGENHGGGIRLSGQFSSSCMEVEDVAISIQGNVIVLQPIVNTRRELDCKSGAFPFKAITFIDFMQEGRYLLHVRTMNGQALNRIVEVR